MKESFKDKDILVIGGSSGIGLDVARSFCESKATVKILSRNSLKLNRAREYLINSGASDAQITLIQCDAADELSLSKAFNDFFPTNALDILINCSGIWGLEEIENISSEVFDSYVNSNFKPIVFSTKYACKHMENGGVIINIGSFAGKIPIKNSSVYSALKSAIPNFTMSASYELAKKNIRVNCVIPGVIRTPPTSDYIDEKGTKLTTNIALNSIGATENISHAIEFLASDSSSYITGATLEVSGGKLVVQP